MYGNRVVGTNGLLVPDLLVDLIDGENLAGIFGEQQQNVVFDGSQFNWFVIHKYFLGIIVDGKAAAFVYVFIAALVQIAELCIAAKLGFDAGNQLQRVKWFGQVIICTDV